MDKIRKYETIILKVLADYAAIPYANLDAKNEVLADKENHRYQVVTIGWDGPKRVHSSPLHMDIINGKIWIQQDRTDYGVANDLVDMGVPKSDIVLAYMSEKRRAEMDFAIA